MFHGKGGKQLTAVLALLLAMLVLLVIILASVPPVSRDALVHHLAVPKLWIEHGGIYEMPDKVFSYYPMAVDLLYLIPLLWGNDIAPKFIHFAFSLATSLLIFNYLKRRLDLNYALLGVLYFLSTPIIVKLSITAYVDLGLIFFSTAALMCLLKWQEQIPRMKYIWLAGLMGGLALGTKYNGLIVMLLLMFIVLLIASQSTVRGRQIPIRAFIGVVIFGGVAVLTYAPWGIKNFVWTGNPVYPLFDQWFNPGNPYETASVPPIVLRKLLYGETWWEILLVPVRIFFQGVDDSPRFFDGRLNPGLLILPVFAFAVTAREKAIVFIRQELIFMLAFAVLLVMLVFFKTSMRMRYIAPAIPFLVILSAFGLKGIAVIVDRYLTRDRARLAALTSLTVMLLPVCFNAVYIIEQFQVVRPLQYLAGHVSRDQYIESYRPEYTVIRHANDLLPAGTRIYSLFIGNRGYYSDHKMTFDIERFKAMVVSSGSVNMFREKMKAAGFSYLLIRYNQFWAWGDDNLNIKEKEIVKALLDNRELLLLAKSGYGLYKL
jgi:4-amino-4-deoxy-L-arabinose transferase-like glycosyltransferase